MEVFVTDSQTQHSIDAEALRNIACDILTYAECPAQAELSIVLVDDAEMQRLNREYRGIDRTTDVLAFAQQETTDADALPPHIDDQAFPYMLGDVILSTETCARQAAEHGHTLSTELHILLIHGILHLLGHDHLEDDEAEAMQRREQEFFAFLQRAQSADR